MATLNLNNFKTVINDDFTQDTSLNRSIWSAAWGNGNQFYFTHSSAGLLISGSAAANWNPVGIEQAPTGKSAGEGYGLYSFTGYAGQAGQGVGICFLLWPADNVWLPSSKPGQASEIDLLESYDGTKTGLSTIHYYDSSAPGNNGQSFHGITGIDLTKSHTYAIDWEPGSLTYYVDGNEIYQDTTHVPLDYAHGGVNETLGAEVLNEKAYVTTPTVQLYIQDISYSAPIAGGGPPAPPPPAPPTIALSAPGTIQEASPGAGVTVTETATTTGLTGSIYWGVLTASGAVESYFAPVTLNANGVATFQVHLASTGDTIVAVDKLTNATTDAFASPVVITDPSGTRPPTAPPSITLSSPGTLQEASPGAGVTVSETISTTGLTGSVYWGVLTASDTVESYFTPVALDANGTATVQVHLAHSGDTIVAVDNLTTPTVGVVGAPVTITDPQSGGPATVSVAKPASLPLGQDTFTGIVTNGTPGTVKFAWHASATGETANASDMTAATKQANGTYTATLTVDHPNQTGYFYVDVDGVVTDEWNTIPVAAQVSPASGNAASPAFIASAATPTTTTKAGAIQAAATSVQGVSGSVTKDMVAGGTGSTASAIVPQQQVYHAGVLLPTQAQQLVSLFNVSHNAVSHTPVAHA